MSHLQVFLRRHCGSNSSKIQQSPAVAKGGLTGGAKRKASPEKNCESIRVSGHARNSFEGGFHIKVLKKNNGEHGDIRRPHEADEGPVSFSMDSGKDSSNINNCNTSEFAVRERSSKTQAATDGDRPTGNRKRVPNPKRGKQKSARAQRAEFEARYQELTRLGVGGFGSVFAGFRKNDYLPVAIKHIPKKNVVCRHVDQNGNRLSAEVAVMLAISAGTNGSVGMSLPVTLLDWYDVHQELILVLERPVPCEDLYKYCKERGGSIEEKEAKIILKQVVDATKYLEDKCIFHRDIKLENILIETSLDVPRARLIDFGLSCFFKKKSVYTVFYGTPKHAPPEWGHFGTYKAGPTTVWQLGVLLFEALNNEASFETQRFLKKKLTTNIKGLSENCQDFLRKCLAIVPEERSTLEELQLHPWLKA